MSRITLSDGRTRVVESGFEFEPLRPSGGDLGLDAVDLPSATEMLVIERRGAALAFVAHEMAYHHVAQGDLMGEPYLVSF